MSLPRFSEIIAARRRELGLSVSQASRVLKLREDVLIAFEEGDYDHMPQSGYAQGMLSSYARYLGLNAREVVDLFAEEVYEYRHGTSSHELRRRTRQTQSGHIISGYETPNEVGSRPKAYVEYRPLLPTGGGPAGDMGDFATTAMARPRVSVPLANAGTPAPGTRGYGGYSTHEDERVSRRGAGRPYNAPSTRERDYGSTARRRHPASRRRDDDPAGRLISESQYSSSRQGRTRDASGRLYLRDDVSTRRVRAGEYTDDMRLDGRARPSVSAATVSGRRSSRNIASVERPNVRRRASRSGASGGRRPPVRGGLLAQFLSDPRRALFALIVLLAVVLTAVLLFSVSSCVNARNQPSPQSVPVQSAEKDAEGSASDADAGDEGDSDAGSQDGTDAGDGDGSAEGSDDGASASDGSSDKSEKTVVEVSVEAGSVSWVEISCDGKSEVAESVTGPWTQSYTVQETITIQVANPDAVTVTKNGKKVSLSSRAGGLGSVTIEGTPLPEGDASDAEGTSDETGESSE